MSTLPTVPDAIRSQGRGAVTQARRGFQDAALRVGVVAGRGGENAIPMIFYVMAWAPYLAALGRGALIAGRQTVLVLSRRIS